MRKNKYQVFVNYLQKLPIWQILFLFLFTSFGIHKLFLSLFVQKLAPRIYSYSYLQEKLLFADQAIYQLCQSMSGTAQGQAGTSRDTQGQTRTSRDKAWTSRDKQGHSLSVPACPYLSLSVPACSCLSLSDPVCPCLSLSVLVSPCLSLYVSNFDIPSCLPLQMNINVFISMNIVTLTVFEKATVSMHAHLVYNFLFTSHLASSITLSFNSNSSFSIFLMNINGWFKLFTNSSWITYLMLKG